MTEDQDAQTETNLSEETEIENYHAIAFCPSMKTIPHLSCKTRRAKALQDYNNKAPDSELVTAPCLHGYSRLMVDIAILAHKAYQYAVR